MSVNGQPANTNLLRRHSAIAISTTIAGAVVATVMAFLSDGFYQDDDITHFLWAVRGWDSAGWLFNWWSRPGYSVFAALPAHFGGLLGCRLFSVAQTTLVAYLAYRIADNLLNRSMYAALVPLFVWLQPLCFQLSLTTLTETPAALYVTFAAAFYVYERRVWACAAMSLACITRYELVAAGLILAIFALFDALRYSQWKVSEMLRVKWLWGAFAALLWAPVLYLIICFLIDMPYDNSPLSLFTRSYTTEYGSGPISHMFAHWPEAIGAGSLVLTFAGIVAFGRGKGAFVSTLVIAMLGVHSWLFWSGSVASGGYPRFMVPMAGLVAVLTVAGLHSVWGESSPISGAALMMAALLWTIAFWGRYPYVFSKPLHMISVICTLVVFMGWALLITLTNIPKLRRRALRSAAALSVLFGFGQFVFQVRPLSVEHIPLHHELQSLIRDLDKNNLGDRPFISQHVFVLYCHGNTELVHGDANAIERWTNAKPGTLYVWENKYSHKPRRASDTASPKPLLDVLRQSGKCIAVKTRPKTHVSFGLYFSPVRIEVYERL